MNGPATTGDTALDRLNLTLRLEGMDATTRRVLDAAAVGDGRLTTARLTAVTRLDRRVVADALGDAVRAGVMDPSDGAQSVRFHHALLREAVVQALFPDDRRAWHRAWAEELHDDLVAAAHHWYEAGEAERALPAAVRAGEQALALSAPFEAALHYRRVLDLWWVVDDPEQLAGVSRRFALTRGTNAVALTADWAAVAALAEREVSRTVPADLVITMWGRLVRARVLRDAGVAYQLAVAPEKIDETVEMLCEAPLEDDLVVSSLSFLAHTTYQTSSRTFAQIVDRIDKAQWPQREGQTQNRNGRWNCRPSEHSATATPTGPSNSRAPDSPGSLAAPCEAPSNSRGRQPSWAGSCKPRVSTGRPPSPRTRPCGCCRAKAGRRNWPGCSQSPRLLPSGSRSANGTAAASSQPRS